MAVPLPRPHASWGERRAPAGLQKAPGELTARVPKLPAAKGMEPGTPADAFRDVVQHHQAHEAGAQLALVPQTPVVACAVVADSSIARGRSWALLLAERS